MNFDVVIIGTDINAYYMARCYHELYKRKAHLIGKKEMSFTSLSRIIDLQIEPAITDDDVFVKTLNDYARKVNKERLVLIATNDGYVRLIVENQDRLDKCYVFNYPSLEILNNLIFKDYFYDIYGHILDIPRTYVYSYDARMEINDNLIYPVILKPGHGLDPSRPDFEKINRIYKIDTFPELVKMVQVVRRLGYKDDLVVQEFIPGGDTALYDAVFYCGKDKKVKLMTFAQVGLQERTYANAGNSTLLVNGFDENGIKEEIVYKLKDFLEKIGYQGFAEFDIKYDYRDGKYKVFEINPRQVRSSYYLAPCGHNLVKYLVDDLVYNKDIPFCFMKEKMVLSFVPIPIIKTYIESEPLKKEVLKLISEKKFVRPLQYKGDKSLMRKIFLFFRDLGYRKKYKMWKW